MNGNELKIVIAGHVDHGKSTLVGRLLCDTGQTLADRREKIEKLCRKEGKKFEFAFLLDAFEEEQDQGITIDYTEIRWRFGGRRFLLIDTPGHREFSKNMATGASRADAAVILVDAAEGIREQFRRHGRILAMLGVKELVVAVNKMDLAGYSARRFEAIKAEAAAFLGGVGLVPSAVVPICAARGENLLAASGKMRWYKGPALAPAMLALRADRDPAAAPLRFSVQDVYKFDEKRIYAGRVDSGTLRRGQKIRFLPSGKETVVKSIEKWRRPGLRSAANGDCVGLTLEDPLFLERGEVAAAGTMPVVSDLVRANVFWMGAMPLAAGRSYKFRLGSQESGCRLASIESIVDASTLKEAAPGGGIARNNMGEVVLRLDKPLAFDEFSSLPELGRFVLADGCRVCGGGIVLGAGGPRGSIFSEKSGVTRAAREKRNGHPGFTVWLTGLSGSGKSTIARGLERALFAAGMQVYVLDGDNIRHGINKDLGFSQADRVENIRRLSEISRLLSDAGLAVITAFISPYESDRAKARTVIGEGNFIEIFVDCPLAACERRDPKGLYRKARRGELPDFTGIGSPYERPRHPDFALRTDRMGPGEAVDKIMDLLKKRGKTGAGE